MPTGVSPSAKSSRMTGTTRWPDPSRVSKSARVVVLLTGHPDHRRERAHVEARVSARVTGGPVLLYRHEHGVAIAVERRASHVLAVPAGIALAPELLPAPAPECHAALGEGSAKRLGVHVAEHEDISRVPLLNDRGD